MKSIANQFQGHGWKPRVRPYPSLKRDEQRSIDEMRAMAYDLLPGQMRGSRISALTCMLGVHALVGGGFKGLSLSAHVMHGTYELGSTSPTRVYEKSDVRPLRTIPAPADAAKICRDYYGSKPLGQGVLSELAFLHVDLASGEPRAAFGYALIGCKTLQLTDLPS